MKKNAILKGTIILTIAGLLTRIIGFFYKIFLSRALGPEKLGVYSLIFPIYGICFTLYASGIQTGISKLVAEEYGNGNEKNAKKILRTGLIASICIALVLSLIIYFGSGFIAAKYLMEAESAASLRVLSYVFPFCGITACINGYYYGKKKAGIPATTQLLEQIVRVAFVYLIALMFGEGNLSITCELAVWGIVVGEIASNIYNILSLRFQKIPKDNHNSDQNSFAKPLAKISFPLSMNRLLISVLHSVEAVMIPAMLKRSGMTTAESLSLFGILTGMTIPFLLFPSTITNSLSVLLLPAISEAKAKANEKLIAHTVSVSLKYSLILGIFSAGFFIYFGDPLGMSVFNIKEAGSYLTILAWLCPFLYAATTLSSVINGLGKAHLTFVNSIIGMSFRIILLAFLVPNFGIMGYLISLLISQLLITGLDFYIVYKFISFPLDSINSIVKPAIVVWFSCSFMYRAYEFVITITNINKTIIILICCALLAIINVAILKTFHAIVRGEWHPKL